jgi:hypothetical protein
MNLQYLQGSYMDEIMFEDRPVLFTLEGLEAGNDAEAIRYGREVWDWIIDHRARVMSHAPMIAKLKNSKWREDDEPETTPEEIQNYLRRISSVYVKYKGGFDIYFDTYDVFHERAIVVHMGKNYVFEGLKLL